MKILKRSMAILLCLTMMLSVMSIGAFAEGEDIIFTIDCNNTVVIGNKLTVDVYAGSTNPDGIKATCLQADLYFDQTRFKNDATATYFNDSVMTEAPAYDPGKPEKIVIAGDVTNYQIAPITVDSKGTKLATFELNLQDGINADDVAKSVLDGTMVSEFICSDDNYDELTTAANVATVKVMDETTISSIVPAAVSVAYDTDLDDAKALFPETVKGSGTTKSGATVSDVDVEVEWNFEGFTTVPETMDAVVVTGTLTAGEGIVIEDGVAATANVTYTKSTEGVVAPLSVNVMKVEDGKELTAAEVVALPEVAALTNTTIKTAKGAEEKISIDLSTAAYVGDVKLNTSLDKGSATLEASVTGTPVFYDITGKKVTITVNMVPAEVKDCKISVSGTTANSKPVVTVTIPASAGIVAGKKIVVKLAPEAALTAEVGGTAEYTITDADVTAMGDAETFTKKIQFDQSIKTMGFATGDKLAFSVEYDGAKLLTEAGEEVVNTKVQATSNPTGGGTITPAPSTSYTVKVAETTNGTASVSASSAMSGETVKVTAVPAEGYVVKDIKVADALGNVVEVKDGAFVMPAANVVVTVEFAEKTEEPTDKPTEETTFVDVPAGHWAAEAIDYLKSVGAVNGKTETEFDPDGSVTRAEFTKMLVSLIDTEAAATGVEFADCPADAWYTPYVAKAVAMGLVNGVSDTEFAPNSTISREDVCTIIGRFLNITAEIEDKELTFTDAADVAEYAARYVAYMAELGIVNGYADGSFGPKASITRAESAKVLYGLSKVLAAKTEVVEEKTEEVVEEVAE